jgi:CheY-like chemotaxis protein
VRAAHEWPPDVAILDLRLPLLDGSAVARRLRELATDKQPLLIAIAGGPGDSDRRRAAEAGIDLCLPRPIDPEVLQRLLRRFQAILGK